MPPKRRIKEREERARQKAKPVRSTGLAARQEDEREAEINRMRREIAKLLPNPMSTEQRAVFEEGIAMNLQSL